MRAKHGLLDSASERRRGNPSRKRLGYGLEALGDYIFGFDYFVSYAHGDGSAYAEKLADRLSQSGFKVFLDKRVYVAGDELRQATRRRIRMSSKVVVLATTRALASDWVRNEIQTSLELRKTPIVIDIGRALANADADSPTKQLLKDRIYISEAPEYLEDPSDHVVAELQRSFRAQRQETTRLRFFGLATVFFAVLAVVAVWQAERAQRGERTARWQLAESFISQGQSWAERGDPGRGFLWLTRCLETSSQLQFGELEGACRANISAWSSELHPLQLVLAPHAAAGTAILLPNSRRLVTGGWCVDTPLGQSAMSDGTADGFLRCWDIDTGAAIGQPIAHVGRTETALVRPDGRAALIGRDETTLQLMGLPDGRPIGPPLRHASKIGEVVASHDLHVVLAGGIDGSLRAWDARSGARLTAVEDAESKVEYIAVSADGHTALTGTANGSIRLWRLPTGGAVGEALRVPVADKPDSLFSPDGRRLVLMSERFQDSVTEVRIFDTANGKPLGSTLRVSGVLWTAMFGPDGRRFFVVGGTEVLLIDAETGRQVPGQFNHRDSLNAVAFSRDGRLFATASEDNSAHVWDSESGRPIGAPLRHGDRVQAVAFSPDGRLIATGSWDNTVRLWDCTTGLAVGMPLWHQQVVWSITFSADGSLLMTTTIDGIVRVWQVQDRHPLIRFWKQETSSRSVEALACSPDGRTMAIDTDRGLLLWDVASGSVRGPRLDRGQTVSCASFSKDGRMTLTGGRDGTARLCETESGRLLGPAFRHPKPIRAVAVDPRGRTVVTGSEDQTARLWDLRTGRPIGSPLEHNAAVSFVAYGRGDVVLTVSDNGTARLSHADTAKPAGPSFRQVDQRVCAAFDPDGLVVAMGGQNGVTGIWDAASGRKTHELLGHTDSITAVAFHPSGRLVLTGSEDRTARLWDVSTARPIGPPLQHSDHVRAVVFGRDGQVIATSGNSGVVRLWDTATGRPIGPVLEHGRGVHSLAFSPDGLHLLTGCDDGSARLWSLPGPVTDQAEALVLRMQVQTGTALDSSGAFSVLDPATWAERRSSLRLLEATRNRSRTAGTPGQL